MLRALRTVVDGIDTFTEYLGRTVAWGTLAMMVVTCLVVVLRYGFGIGSIALQESIMYLHGIVFMLGIPYALRHDAHVRVDVLYSRFSQRTRDLVDLAGHLLFLLPLAGYILWISWGYTARSWRIGEGSAEVGGIEAVYLLKSLIPLLGVLLILQGLVEITRIVLRLAGHDATPRTTPGETGPGIT